MDAEHDVQALRLLVHVAVARVAEEVAAVGWQHRPTETQLAHGAAQLGGAGLRHLHRQ